MYDIGKYIILVASTPKIAVSSKPPSSTTTTPRRSSRRLAQPN